MFIEVSDRMIVGLILGNKVYKTKKFGKKTESVFDEERFEQNVQQYRNFGHSEFCKHYGVTKVTILKWLNNISNTIQPITNFRVYQFDDNQLIKAIED